jgi:hypothetical protein
MVWWWVVAFVVAAVVSYSVAPKAPEPKPPAMKDVEVPTAEAGAGRSRWFLAPI